MITHKLKFSYDDRNFLEIWNPKFDFGPEVPREAGLYETLLDCAKVKGAQRAFDSLKIDAFSKCYLDALEEVRRKEPAPEKESYDVPDLGLYHVPLSRIIEEIYYKFVSPKRDTWVETANPSTIEL
jgi:hypothetical protein